MNISKMTDMLKRYSCFVLIILAFLNHGCDGRGRESNPETDVDSDDYAQFKFDSWYSEPQGELRAATWQRIKEEQIHEVLPSKQTDAQALLASCSFVKLTEMEAMGYSPGFTQHPSKSVFLVRGVKFSGQKGVFWVYHFRDYLEVTFGCLGCELLEMTREAVVVELDFVPKEVFVTVSRAK